jgi:acyl-coenzyme A thioesterase PaaI-like protein
MLATAIASVLEEEEWSMTIEFKLNFLRILKPGLCEGSARVIRRTRSIAFLDAEIRDDAGAVAVTVTSTWSIARR